MQESAVIHVEKNMKNMKKYFTSVFLIYTALSAYGQSRPLTDSKKAALEGRDYIESTSYNEEQRGAERSLQYYPDGEDFVCKNGKNRFTRPLYGTHTAWRLETSDRPVFASYGKPKSRHIAFRIQSNGQSIALDSTEYCEARYTPGRRSYILSDSRWKQENREGKLHVTALPLHDKEGAIWYFNASSMPKDIQLSGLTVPIRAKRLNRSGDMGADPADSFEASLTEVPERFNFKLAKGEGYVIYENGKLRQLPVSKGKALYNAAEKARTALTSRFRIETPDPYINTLGGALVAAADGIWDGEVWLHGANGWRMPLSGWRAAYTGDCLGWHDRARRHFDNYAASQVTDIAPVYPHPTQDSVMNMARSAKKWGTQMYSNGYICRNPNRNNQMHHYDMNLCYIDELLWHLCWTGDLDYAKKMWPVITRHLAWEKRNFDPDNDGLYDAYCCIWASDALYYNSGAVTHSSAYNYRANKLAAEIAGKIGEDARPYAQEAEKIKQALQRRFWMDDKGCWAEFQDYMGHKQLHTSPAVWTVYHAIDSEVSGPFQYYQATRYIDRNIPRIPVQGAGLKDEGYYTVATTNWMPYSWSINNVAFAEVWHTALAYWQAGRPEEAFHLFKSSVLDGMYLGHCPGNFGQISFYDSARGECYRDFGDPIGVASRVLTQGLFGIYPDLLEGRVDLRPGFPQKWNHASLHATYMDFSFAREGDKETYRIEPRFKKQATIRLIIPAWKENYESVRVNGQEVTPEIVESVGMPRIAINCPAEKKIEIEINWIGKRIAPENAGFASFTNESSTVKHALHAFSGTGSRTATAEPKNSLAASQASIPGKPTVSQGNHPSPISSEGSILGTPGNGTWFVRLQQGTMQWWQPVTMEKRPKAAPFYGTELPVYPLAQYRPIQMDTAWNANVTDIFRNKYPSPRSPYTTLQIPLQGIGEWCHPKETADIDDTGFRKQIRNRVFTTPQGIPFRTPAEGKNIAYTTLWDNYPDSVCVKLDGKAMGIYLLLAGSTNHMQCRHENGIIRVTYQDGSQETLSLVNPENWAPIEQDLYFDGVAFQSAAPRPYRVVLSSGHVSNRLEKDLQLKGFNDRRIPGGAATILYLPLDKKKELKQLSIETRANDVVIGLMGGTLVE